MVKTAVQRPKKGPYRVLAICPEGMGRSGLLGAEVVRSLGGTIVQINDFAQMPYKGMRLARVPELGAGVHVLSKGLAAYEERRRANSEEVDAADLVILPGKTAINVEALDRLFKEEGHGSFNARAFKQALKRHEKRGTMVFEELLKPKVVTNRAEIIRRLKKSRGENG